MTSEQVSSGLPEDDEDLYATARFARDKRLAVHKLLPRGAGVVKLAKAAAGEAGVDLAVTLSSRSVFLRFAPREAEIQSPDCSWGLKRYPTPGSVRM